MKYLNSLILILSQFLTLCAVSQDISKYLDDGTNSTTRQILSLGFDPINSSFPVTFERGIVENFSYVIRVDPL